ncbi:helix-turn-helix domain-containing protein [Sphingomonas gei]|uniref:helix-turn-helix domain-containing protein n=1 Tax=Sphingomonas gei TaxID=1395960 RepID=UPI001F0D3E73|nr:helix-turn-helix transcriptional regulator [Sphingomonas gei]
MSTKVLNSTAAGDLLKLWRERRGKSQLDLAIDASVSQRHISFIENGRSIPSRQMLLSLAGVLDLPLRDRNALLLAGGFAPIYSERTWDSPGMGSLTAAVQRMLRQQEPYPAIVLDRYWNVVMTNEASPRFFGKFVDLGRRPEPRNMLHLIFDPDGMRPFVVDWERTAATLIARVHRETAGRVTEARTRALIDGLLAYPDVESHWRDVSQQDDLPMIPLSFMRDGTVLSYFSMVTTVGAPMDVLTQELRIESLFPANAETELYHEKHFA